MSRHPLFAKCRIAVLIILCRAVAALGTDGDVLPFNIDPWLRGPDREDFSWKVTIHKPILTFQQRLLVRIQTTIGHGSLGSGSLQHDLHIVVKVAPENKDWESGYSYTHIPVSSDIDRSDKIDSFNGLYLKPGRYTIAVIVYDAVLKRGNIARKYIRVPPLKGVRLPDLDRDLPQIEFIDGVPRNLLTGFPGFILEPSWPLGKGREWLPVENHRCLCIDIVAYTGNDYYYYAAYSRSSPVSSQRRMKHLVETGHILEMASVLSHLRPRKGRVRVSILNMDKMETVFDREDAGGFDWRHASDVVENLDQNTIDVDRIHPGPASAYQDSILRGILGDEDCASQAELPAKIVIIVSRDLFIDKQIKSLIPKDTDSVRFYYFWAMEQPQKRDGAIKISERGKFRKFTFFVPKDFRKKLASLISELEDYY